MVHTAHATFITPYNLTTLTFDEGTCTFLGTHTHSDLTIDYMSCPPGVFVDLFYIFICGHIYSNTKK